jgi:hypothetical protein
MSSANIAIDEARRSQTASVKDIFKLRNPDATSPPSVPTRLLTTDFWRTSIIAPTITSIILVGIVDVAPYMRRKISAGVVVGVVIVDIAWTYRQVDLYTMETTETTEPMVPLSDRIPSDFTGLRGPHDRFGIGNRRAAEQTGRQHASDRNRCEKVPASH